MFLYRMTIFVRTQVLSYLDVLRGAAVGPRVAVVGAGGIGFDVAEFVTHLHWEGHKQRSTSSEALQPAMRFKGNTSYDNADRLPSAYSQEWIDSFLDEWGIDGKVLCRQLVMLFFSLALRVRHFLHESCTFHCVC